MKFLSIGKYKLVTGMLKMSRKWVTEDTDKYFYKIEEKDDKVDKNKSVKIVCVIATVMLADIQMLMAFVHAKNVIVIPKELQ